MYIPTWAAICQCQLLASQEEESSSWIARLFMFRVTPSTWLWIYCPSLICNMSFPRQTILLLHYTNNTKMLMGLYNLQLEWNLCCFEHIDFVIPKVASTYWQNIWNQLLTFNCLQCNFRPYKEYTVISIKVQAENHPILSHLINHIACDKWRVWRD